jgi:hypothetical protein
MRKKLLYALAAVGSVLFGGRLVEGCGMVVHMDVSERALNSWRATDDTYPYEAILR